MVWKDPRGESGRLLGKAAHSEMDDTIAFYKLVWKAVTLPFWLPFWLKRRSRIRKEMISFGEYWYLRNMSYKDIAVKWAEQFPKAYPLGEYDPGLKKLEAQFRRLSEDQRSAEDNPMK